MLYATKVIAEMWECHSITKIIIKDGAKLILDKKMQCCKYLAERMSWHLHDYVKICKVWFCLCTSSVKACLSEPLCLLVLPGGKPTGVLCGESSAPLRRGGNSTTNNSADAPTTVRSCLRSWIVEGPNKVKPESRQRYREATIGHIRVCCVSHTITV